MNLEVRFPITEGPGFLDHVFVERTDEGSVCIGITKKAGYAYVWADITPEQWWRMSRILFPDGDPDRRGDRPDLG
jgi:hypothetical protein